MQELPKVLLGINYYSGANNERAAYLNTFLKSIRKYSENYKGSYDIIVFERLGF